MDLLSRVEAAGWLHASLVGGIQQTDHWNWIPEHRDCFILNWRVVAREFEVDAPALPPLPAGNAGAGASASSTHISSSATAPGHGAGRAALAPHQFRVDLVRELVEVVVAKLPGDLMVRCRSLDRAFRDLLAGPNGRLRQLLPSLVPESSPAGPFLLTAGKLAWFPATAAGLTHAHTLPVGSGWRQLNWKELRLGAVPLCVLSCSQGVVLCATEGAGDAFSGFVKSLVAVNPTTKEKVELDVVAVLEEELQGEERYRIMDASLQTTVLASSTEVLLNLFLWVESADVRGRKERRFLHLVHRGGGITAVCSVCPWAWTPVDLITAFEFRDTVSTRSNVANIQGLFYSLHWAYGSGAEGGHGWSGREENTGITFQLWECDFREEVGCRSVWSSIPVAPLSLRGRWKDREEMHGSELRYFLIGWGEKPAMVEVVMGQATSVDRDVQEVRCGVKRISLMLLGALASSSKRPGVAVRCWVPAPGFNVFNDHGSRVWSRSLDLCPNLYRFGFSFATSNEFYREAAPPHALGVGVFSQGSRIFCTLNLQDGIDGHPPKVLVYEGNAVGNGGTWMMAMAPPPDPSTSTSNSRGDLVQQSGYNIDVAAQRFLPFDPSFVALQ